MRWQVGPSGLGLLVGVGLVGMALSACGDDAGPGEGSAGTGGATSGVTWCEVREVLEARCQRCHVSEPLNGAPFALVTYADTQVVAAGIARWQRMSDMVERRLMPPADVMLDPPAQQPTEPERELLLAWFDQGARSLGGTSAASQK